MVERQNPHKDQMPNGFPFRVRRLGIKVFFKKLLKDTYASDASKTG